MNFNDVLRGFLITFEHERRRPFTMSLFQNLEVREPSGNDEGKKAGREREKREKFVGNGQHYDHILSQRWDIS